MALKSLDPRVRGDDGMKRRSETRLFWIPTFTGMTAWSGAVKHACRETRAQ